MKLRPDRKAVHIVMKKELYERLQKFSEYESETMTFIVKKAILEYLNKYEVKPTVDKHQIYKNIVTGLMKKKFVNDDWSRGLEFIDLLDTEHLSYLSQKLSNIEINHPSEKMGGFIYWTKWKLSTSHIETCRESFNKKFQ